MSGTNAQPMDLTEARTAAADGALLQRTFARIEGLTTQPPALGAGRDHPLTPILREIAKFYRCEAKSAAPPSANEPIAESVARMARASELLMRETDLSHELAGPPATP
ncbi:MAG: hypothetical protein AAF321_06340, partial [Pseudomonadota bacterium]